MVNTSGTPSIIDPTAKTFGLPPCLHVPIAARSVDCIKTYVGTILQTRVGRSGRLNAILVEPYIRNVNKHPDVRLWKEPQAGVYEARLYGGLQVWVHVDYRGYRIAYQKFGMPPIPKGDVLDHIQNRVAIRLRNYSHPYLRLCPVSGQVNTSGGSDYGIEGMEKEYLKYILNLPPDEQARAMRGMQSNIIYADPMDLTKMLNSTPGTRPLHGVRTMQRLFFPD